MKDGRFVESGDGRADRRPARSTEYTQKLLAAVPELGPWDDARRDRPPLSSHRQASPHQTRMTP